mmetsp:Transcript_74794/g.207984  ORF Transcript_74794/g.207984 Transcript_74794/m.207984 type:complete len:200 (+) Transcript_74794:41-640(+)
MKTPLWGLSAGLFCSPYFPHIPKPRRGLQLPKVLRLLQSASASDDGEVVVVDCVVHLSIGEKALQQRNDFAAGRRFQLVAQLRHRDALLPASLGFPLQDLDQRFTEPVTREAFVRANLGDLDSLWSLERGVSQEAFSRLRRWCGPKRWRPLRGRHLHADRCLRLSHRSLGRRCSDLGASTLDFQGRISDLDEVVTDFVR